VTNVNVNLNDIRDGLFDGYAYKKISDNVESHGLVLKKTDSEKELIQHTLDIIQDWFRSDWLIVFRDGNYSDSASDYAMEISNKNKKRENES
jgi:hypothetical protein